MGLSENTRGNDATGGGVVMIVMILGALVIALLTLQKVHADRAPEPTPSVSASTVAHVVTIEDSAPWSCRTSGNHLCGETDVWVWGIHAFA